MSSRVRIEPLGSAKVLTGGPLLTSPEVKETILQWSPENLSVPPACVAICISAVPEPLVDIASYTGPFGESGVWAEIVWSSSGQGPQRPIRFDVQRGAIIALPATALTISGIIKGPGTFQFFTSGHYTATPFCSPLTLTEPIFNVVAGENRTGLIPVWARKLTVRARDANGVLHVYCGNPAGSAPPSNDLEVFRANIPNAISSGTQLVYSPISALDKAWGVQNSGAGGSPAVNGSLVWDMAILNNL